MRPLRRPPWCGVAVSLLALSLAQSLQPASAVAQDSIAALIERLDAEQQRQLQAWREARASFEAETAAYWEAVRTKRTERRRKIRANQAVAAEDYVLVFPPEYTGPKLTPELAALIAKEQEEKRAGRPPPEPVPPLEDYLAQATAVYGFAPERISEPDFKRRFAREALAYGLTRDQVVRVYAFETGGNGTADMQSGINPTTKQGKPISSAVGYAQLLAANSINELVKHGEGFVARLGQMAATPGTPKPRAAALRKKQQVVRKMLTKARSVPAEWAAHVRLAGTPEGMGIHVLNLDGDVGPWLQALKLNDIRKFAASEGRPVLTAAELEIMNLVGPDSGLEVVKGFGAPMPSSNFFQRGGYERNSVARGRTGGELLAEIDRRMDINSRQPGAVEFARIFDEVAREPR